MKVPGRVLVLLVLVMAGFALEAQTCLKCFRNPPSFGGFCGEAFPDQYCDRQCCYAWVGMACTIPDFLDECDPWLTRTSNAQTSVVRKTVGIHTEDGLFFFSTKQDGMIFFTSRRPIEIRREALHRRLQKLDPAAPKCTART